MEKEKPEIPPGGLVFINLFFRCMLEVGQAVYKLLSQTASTVHKVYAEAYSAQELPVEGEDARAIETQNILIKRKKRMLAFFAWATVAGIFVGILMESYMTVVAVILMFGFLVTTMSNANSNNDS